MKIRASSGLWLLVGALVCIIVLVLALFLFILPERNKAGEVDEEIDNTEQSIRLEENRLSQLRQYEKDPEQFTRQIDVLKERVPENVELADVIQQLDHAAEEAGLDFYSITPDLPISSGNFYVVNCDVTMQGRYFNLVEFFNHLERLPRSFKVVFLELTEGDNGLPYLLIDLKIKVFFTTNQGIENLVSAQAGQG